MPGMTERKHTRWLLSILLLAPFMSQADATIANVATPSIRLDLGASGAALELLIGGYLIAFAMLLITGARLGQTHGYKRMFLLGMAIFAVASLACGLAPTPSALIVARVLQGTGAALMFPQALTGIQLAFDGPQRARAVGLYAIALSAGAVTGQILGGLLISADVFGTTGARSSSSTSRSGLQASWPARASSRRTKTARAAAWIWPESRSSRRPSCSSSFR